MTISHPSTIGRYEILGEVGRGTMGVVYEAQDPSLGRTVAVKTVSIGQAIPPAEREAFEHRFMAEAKVVARLTHPNIVVVHDVGRDEETGTLFMALEFLRGRNLARVISPTPSPTPSPRPTPEPARLDIDFGHYLKGGILRVWIDDVLVVRLPLESRTSKKVLGFTLHEGKVRGRVPLDPGLHTVKLEVSWDDNVRAQTIAGRFAPDQTRTLEVRLQRLRKRLAVGWRDGERGER